MSLSILITNIVLSGRSGTEVVTEQLADGLRRRGHRVAVFTPLIGHLGQQMRARGHLVVDKPGVLPWQPDVIHAHHTAPAMAALVAHPGVPALFVCHDASSPFDAIPPHPRVRRVFAVDERCRARLAAEGVPLDAISLLPNAVDLARIQPRSRPLPSRPKSALVATKHDSHLAAVREACKQAGISLTEFGFGPRRISDALESEFSNVDLVFATARMALEAAAAGAGVIVCDGRGFAGFLTLDRAKAWLPWNLGAGILKDALTPAAIEAAISEWSVEEIGKVESFVHANRGLESLIDQLEDIYHGMLQAPAVLHADEENAAVGAFITGWVPGFDSHAPWRHLAEAVSTLRLGPYATIEDQVAELSAGTGDLAKQVSSVAYQLAAQQGQFDQFSKCIIEIYDLMERMHAELGQLSRERAGLSDDVATKSHPIGQIGARAWAMERDSAGLKEFFGLVSRQTGSLDPALSHLRNEITALRAELAAYASPNPAKQGVWDRLRSVWRRTVPASIREPLHRLRHRFSTLLGH